jgi:hypothetical protein
MAGPAAWPLRQTLDMVNPALYSPTAIDKVT